MTHIFRILILVSLIITSFPTCANNNAWDGIYIYEASAGKNIAEDEIVLEYTFKYSATKCEIQIQGYQTSEAIICSARETNSNLEVAFKSYSNGSTKNAYDVEVYPAGILLFALAIKDKTIVTTWAELMPDGAPKKSGKYFIKHK